MTDQNSLELGTWNALCDRCGFKFKANKLKKEWNGLYTCEKCWEPRHPSDFFRVTGENTSVPYARPDSTNNAYGTIGNANTTLIVGTDEGIQYASTTLTANRTITLSNTGAQAGDQFIIYSTHGSAYTLDVAYYDNEITDTFTDDSGTFLENHTSDNGNTYSAGGANKIVFTDSNRVRANTVSAAAPYTVGGYTFNQTNQIIKFYCEIEYFGNGGNETWFWRFGSDTDASNSYLIGVNVTTSGGNDVVTTATYDTIGGYSTDTFSSATSTPRTIYITVYIDTSEDTIDIYGDFVDGTTLLNSYSYSPTFDNDTLDIQITEIDGTASNASGSHLDLFTVDHYTTIKTLPASLDTRSIYEFNGTKWFLKDYQVIEL